MEQLIYVISAALAAYLIGSIPFGLLLGRLRGIDIREHGSRNIGATNVTRTLGKPWGYTCFVLDMLKGALPVTLAYWLTRTEGLSPTLPVWTALAAVLGHIFPIYLKFKGGKGVSTIIGVLVMMAPAATLVGLVTWVSVFFLFKYVSLASIAMSVALPLAAAILTYAVPPETLPAWTRQTSYELGLLTLLAVISIVKHRSNIIRLRNGTELRFGTPKGEEKS